MYGRRRRNRRKTSASGKQITSSKNKKPKLLIIRKVRLSFFIQLSEKELVFFSVCADFPQSFCQCANGCFRQASCLLGTYADTTHAGYAKVFICCLWIVFWNGTHRTVCHAFAAALAGIGYHWHQTTAMTFQIRSVTGSSARFGVPVSFSAISLPNA